MEKKKQTMRFSDDELGLIKSVFADEQERLFAMRKLFLQMPLDVIDKSYLEVFQKNDPLMKVVRKAFLPELEPTAPINQEVDLIMTLELKDKSPEQALPHIMARQMLIQYLDEQLYRMSGGNVEEGLSFEDLSELPKPTDARSMIRADELYARLVARNMLVSHVEMQLNQFNVLGGMKEETIEQTKERLQKNSNQ